MWPTSCRYPAARRPSSELSVTPVRLPIASAMATGRLECPWVTGPRWSTAWATATITCGPASLSIATRLPSASSSSVTSCGNVQARSLPSRLARYRAWSAAMISSAAVNPSSGYEATPMLNVRWRPGIVFTPAAWTASTMRYASRWAAAPELAGVGEPGQAVRRGLLAAAVVAQGVGDRDGGAAGQGVDGEEVLIGERPRDLAEQDQHRRSVAGRDRHDHSRAVGREDSLPGACGL